MPGKSRRAKAKRYIQAKKMGGQRAPSPVGQQPAELEAHEQPAPQPRVSIPSMKVPTRNVAAISPAVRYAYVTTELRTIGILAGIMLVVLIVLALVLS
ncbi:MAG: hypothetical protein HY665_03480 [Chloroflexi bacterium]|nr:hypothetical protein [Chloroflexota bacterium]